MATIDLIVQVRIRYLSSAHTRRDWVRYVTEIERLRAQRTGEATRHDGGLPTTGIHGSPAKSRMRASVAEMPFFPVVSR